MTYKSRHSLPLLFLLCIIGSTITTSILYNMLKLNLILSTIIFLLLSYFLMKLVYFGNIRSIICKDKEIEFHYEKIKKINYTDIQAIWIKADPARRLNNRQSKRLINFIVILNNQESITIPYTSFLNHLYEIIQFVHEKNPNVLLDPISYMTKNEFYQLLTKIGDCEIKPTPFIRNEFRN